MRITLHRHVLPLALLTCSAVIAQDTRGVDWPQWRGPDRTGVSSETDWSAEGREEPLWRKTLGLGHSSFAIVDGRLYTLAFDEKESQDRVLCLDAATGEEHWSYTYPCEIWDNAHDGGTLTTPSVVDGAVYTSNREGKVFCFDAKDGAVRWQRDLSAEMKLMPPTWGFSASPLIVGDQVIMNVDRVVALDRRTGTEVWATEKEYGIAYSTPAPFSLEGRSLLASLSGDGLVVLDEADGSEVDFFPWVKTPQIYPMTPVVIGDRIFISGGYARGCAMLQLKDGKLEQLWAGRAMRNKMSGCILWKDHLFGFDESILKCIDLDGNMRWRTRGLGTGSMTIAGGRLVILDGKGQVIIAEANPDEYIELSRQSVFDDGTAWSSPVLSHGRIYCRTSKGEMACLDHRGTGVVASAVASAAAREVPTAEAILARHIEALGGMAASAEVLSVRMTGTGSSLRNTVDTGSVELDWESGVGFSWRDDSGFQLAHDPDLGWVTGLRSGPALLDGEELDAVREAGDLDRLFNPQGTYAAMESKSRTVFDNRPCYSVAAKTREGHERTLYFEIESGLFAGHEGDGIPMWTLGAYRSFDGVLLPTRWAFFEPEMGEMSSADFSVVTVNPENEADPFVPPAIIQMLLRTPEEVEEANEELRKQHAGILGSWRGSDWPAEDPDSRFEVLDGFLVVRDGEHPPSRMSLPDENGSIVIIGSEYIRFTPVSDDKGTVTGITVHIDGDLEETLARVAD